MPDPARGLLALADMGSFEFQPPPPSGLYVDAAATTPGGGTSWAPKPFWTAMIAIRLMSSDWWPATINAPKSLAIAGSCFTT